jgi:hypothetical protein
MDVLTLKNSHLESFVSFEDMCLEGCIVDCLYQLVLDNGEFGLRMNVIEKDYESVELLVGTNGKIFNCYSSFKMQETGLLSFKIGGKVYLVIDNLLEFMLIFKDISPEEKEVIRCFYNETGGFATDRETVFTVKRSDGEDINVPLMDVCREIKCEYKMEIVGNSLVLHYPDNLEVDYLQILVGMSNLYFGQYDGYKEQKIGEIVVDSSGDIYLRIYLVDLSLGYSVLFDDLTGEEEDIIASFYVEKDVVFGKTVRVDECTKDEIVDEIVFEDFCQTRGLVKCGGEMVKKNMLIDVGVDKYQFRIEDDKLYFDFLCLDAVLDEVCISVGKNNMIFGCCLLEGEAKSDIITGVNGEKVIMYRQVEGSILLFDGLSEVDKSCIREFYSETNCDMMVKYEYEDKGVVITEELFRGDLGFKNFLDIVCGYSLEVIDRELWLYLPDGVVDENYSSMELLVGVGGLFFGCFGNFRGQVSGILISDTDGNSKLKFGEEVKKMPIVLFDNLTDEEIDCMKTFYSSDLSDIVLTVYYDCFDVADKYVSYSREVGVELFCSEFYKTGLTYVLGGIILKDYLLQVEQNGSLSLTLPLNYREENEKLRYLELLVGYDGKIFGLDDDLDISLGFVIIKEDGRTVLTIANYQLADCCKLCLFRCLTRKQIMSAKLFYSLEEGGGFMGEMDKVLNIVEDEVGEIGLERFQCESVDGSRTFLIGNKMKHRYKMKIVDNKLVLDIPVVELDVHLSDFDLIVGLNNKLFNCSIGFPSPVVGDFRPFGEYVLLNVCFDVNVECNGEYVLFSGLREDQVECVRNFYNTKSCGGVFSSLSCNVLRLNRNNGKEDTNVCLKEICKVVNK